MNDWNMVHCARCGERVGVYEPIRAVGTDGPADTSLAREPALARAVAGVMHAACGCAGAGSPATR